MGLGSEMKKVLLVTAFFPPYMNVATSRVIKFLKYLPSLGWQAVVLCPDSDKEHSEASRNALLQLGEDVRIVRSGRDLFNELVDRRGGSGWASLVSRVMNNIIPPDGHLYWALSCLPRLGRIIEVEQPDLVFTTCNPYSLNLVGAWVKHRYQLPWVTDFRDLWTMNQQPKRFLNSYHQAGGRVLEDFFMKRCDHVVVTTENSAKRLVAKYPFLKGRVSNIPNGYDPEDVKGLGEISRQPHSFFYSGSIVANTGYNPLPLLRVAARALSRLADSQQVFFHYAGPDGDTFGDLLREAQMPGEYISHGYLSHESLYRLIQEMEHVLMCLPPDVDCTSWIPSRFYDYIGNRAGIICLAPGNSEVLGLLGPYGNGLNLHYGEDEEGQVVKLTEYLKSDTVSRADCGDFIEGFSRQALTGRLAEVFMQTVASG